jgi:signal transduction histidine kinase
MASPVDERALRKRLAHPAVLAGIVVPVIAITALHYGTSHEHHWVHDILRRAYYLPITVAAVTLGLRGALTVAALVSLAYLPHAFFFEHHFDPARGLEKGLEIVLYFMVAAVAGTLSDKEQRRREQLQASLGEQQALTKQLVRAGRLSALGEVVAGIAHEIKNPLHALQGTAEIVDPLIPKEAEERRMWDLHKDEIKHLGSVADRFLSFAKPAPIQAVEINLTDVATRLGDLAGAEARQNEITLTCHGPAEPVCVKGDLDQLAQLGLNIVLNAIKAIGTGPGEIRIEVGTTRREAIDTAFLCIENSGPPVSEYDLENLFTPFYSKSESTGLGLAISARIAEQHSGTIEVENRKEGVAFTLFLPLAG